MSPTPPTAPLARRLVAQRGRTVSRDPCTRCPANPRTLASGAASSALGCGRRGDRRDRSGACSSRRHRAAIADLGAHPLLGFIPFTVAAQDVHGDRAGRRAWAGSGRPPVIPGGLASFRLHPPVAAPAPTLSLLGSPPLTPAVQLRRDLWRPSSAESAKRPPQAASNRSPDHVGSALQAGV